MSKLYNIVLKKTYSVGRFVVTHLEKITAIFYFALHSNWNMEKRLSLTNTAFFTLALNHLPKCFEEVKSKKQSYVCFAIYSNSVH